jgi:hypothetical protein
MKYPAPTIAEMPPQCPWTRCTHDGVDREVLCLTCFGLGFVIPPGDAWLESEWTLLLMAEARSLVGITLDGSYPAGGYLVMPPTHPRFAEAVAFLETYLHESRCTFALADRALGAFDLRTKSHDPTFVVRKTLYPVLFLSLPAREKVSDAPSP